MRGLKIKHKRTCDLLRQARENKGLSQDEAATVIGFHSRQHLCRVEAGEVGITAKKLKRAFDLYGMDRAAAIEAAAEDYRDSLNSFFRERA